MPVHDIPKAITRILGDPVMRRHVCAMASPALTVTEPRLALARQSFP